MPATTKYENERIPTKEELSRIAKGFEVTGVKELITRKVVKVSGLSERRTLELLPDKYKQRKKAGKVGGVVSAAFVSCLQVAIRSLVLFPEPSYALVARLLARTLSSRAFCHFLERK